MYITPANEASIASARACGPIGRMSPMPTLDSVLKLRNSSSNHVRGRAGSTRPVKLPGYYAWHTANANAKPHASRVKVAAVA